MGFDRAIKSCKTGVIWFFWMTPLLCGASAVHNNQVTLVRASPDRISFVFELNIGPLLNRLISPQLSFDEFLSKYSKIGVSEFKNDLVKASKTLETDCQVFTPDGATAGLSNWQFPDAPQLQVLIKKSIFLSQMEPEQAHIEPVTVRAQVVSKKPLYRFKLQLPNYLMPVWVVNGEHDKFWLTEKMPLQIIDIAP
jgi:hypothetical protein